MTLLVSDIQRLLKAAGFYDGAIDNAVGPKTDAAVDKALKSAPGTVSYASYSAIRRRVAAAQIVLKAAGYADVGVVDGYAGMLTEQAYADWSYKQINGVNPAPWRPDDEPEQPPKPTSFGSQSDMAKLYGPAGGAQCQAGKVVPPFKLKLAWDLNQTISKFSCHEKVADSANRAYAKIASAYSPENIIKLGLDLWGGCYNYRLKRGGTSLSTHAYGLAIDTDPIRNQLMWKSDRARLAQPDASEFFKCWESEGWLSLGKARNFDWMHVQAVSL